MNRVASTQPLVCIAMPVHNAEKTLALALRSILFQTYSHWELRLVDDGSSDATLSIARSFNDPRIMISSDGERKGLAVRLNQIIDCCRGNYIARLDADDIAYPERLERQVIFLDANRNIDLVGTGAMVFGSDGEAVGLFPIRQTHAEICRKPWSGFYLAHPTWMGRVEWFRKYRYRPDLAKAQDQNLLLRAYKTSTFACLPEVLTGYRQESLSLKKILTGRYYFSKSLVREAWRHGAYPQFLLAILTQAAKACVDTFAIATGLDRLILRHRALPIDENERNRWNRCWAGCNRVEKA